MILDTRRSDRFLYALLLAWWLFPMLSSRIGTGRWLLARHEARQKLSYVSSGLRYPLPRVAEALRLVALPSDATPRARQTGNFWGFMRTCTKVTNHSCGR